MSNLDTNELFGGKHVHDNILCVGCRYAHGNPPLADAPNKSYCKVYRREDGIMKPGAVCFGGGTWKFRDPE